MSFNKTELLRRWVALSPRERLLLMAGLAVMTWAALYGVVYQPMQAENQRLQQQILAQQQIHRHLREVAQQVDLLRQAGVQAAVEAVEPAAVIADSSQQLGFDTYIVRRQADAAGGIELELQQMPFDKMVYWLAVLQQQHAIVVIQLDVHRHADDNDLLDGSLMLSPINRGRE